MGLVLLWIYATVLCGAWCLWRARARAFDGWTLGAMASALDGDDSLPPTGGGGGRPPVDIRAAVSAPTMQARLRRWLYGLLIPKQDREDVAQDATMQALRSADTYDPSKSRPERWFNRIALHVAAHWHQRARHRHEVLQADPPELEAEELPADVALAQEEDRLTLLEALQSVPLELRAIVVAHELHGIPMRDVAKRSGVPVSTAYKWRAQGLAALADAFRKLRR